ncbi:hypothetical protein ScPMuIL_015596 [Solemya velum]
MNRDARLLGKSGHFFTNWATTYSCQPELFFEPTTTEEIRQILACARDRGKKVRVIGKGHSPSDLACTTDYMISLEKYNRVRSVDRQLCQIKVEGGMTIQELNDNVLPANNMALSVQGSVSNLTIAGVMCTGTHGTGELHGIMSTCVKEFEIMTASGDIMDITEETYPELFRAVSVSLGAFGVILTVTLQCEPAYNLHQSQYGCKLDQVLENLNVHITASDHFRFMWFPFTDSVVCYHAKRTTKAPQNDPSWFWNVVVGYYVLEFLLWISTFLPFLVCYINRLYYRLHCAPKECVDRGDRIFNFDCLFKQYVMEWAIPREKTALVLKDIEAWIINSNFPAHFPIEVRFVKADDIYLSPAYGRETCYINIIMYRPYNKYVPFEEYWNAFADIVLKVGGRPHWAKDHSLTADRLRSLYPGWDRFCQLRLQYDPNGMFLNANLERVFGLFLKRK